MTKKAKFKLEDLDVREVSLVSRPAIGRQYLLTKAADDSVLNAAATKRENGYDFPASAFAYVPDPQKPSTWKLRLWESPTEKVTRRQVGLAVAALGKGFRGNKVQIPSNDLASVKAKVRAAWKSVHDSGEELPSVLKEAGDVPANDLGSKHMNEKLRELLKSVESDEVREAITAAFDALIANKDAVSEDLMKNFYQEAGFEVPVIEKEVEVEKIVEKEVIKEVEVEKQAEDSEETILKGLDERALALFKEQKDRAAKAEAEVEKVRIEKAEAEDARIKQEYIQKAEKDWVQLGLEAEALGPALRVIEGLDESIRNPILSVFEKAKGAVELTKQDVEFGNAGNDGRDGNSEPEYVRKAKELVAKGEAKTFEQAVAHLAKTNPELDFYEGEN